MENRNWLAKTRALMNQIETTIAANLKELDKFMSRDYLIFTDENPGADMDINRPHIRAAGLDRIQDLVNDLRRLHGKTVRLQILLGHSLHEVDQSSQSAHKMYRATTIALASAGNSEAPCPEDTTNFKTSSSPVSEALSQEKLQLETSPENQEDLRRLQA
ncbi:hypothetical protein Micbo1qcDRAFT_176689 [Microdochium bolleyi]|uniref:Uncharacterized protein n=1 Tax=Microdochium bolleyi TaxID=196109 RepID=A0A136IYY5_9PEZI|nr:hypothetical protein Micbo1qcDRAFT_176689 [Microdochium bolleyi]